LRVTRRLQLSKDLHYISIADGMVATHPLAIESG
jgi:hypothetical protein